MKYEGKNKIISNKKWVLNDLKFLPETNTVDTLKALVVSKLLEEVGYLVPSFWVELEISTTIASNSRACSASTKAQIPPAF